MTQAQTLTACTQDDHITCLALGNGVLASSSLDHSIHLSYPSSPQQPTVELVRAHDSPVLCLCWSSIQFDSILASGAADGTIRIWAEDSRVTEGKKSKWVSKALLTEARGTIRGIEFSPAEFGLKLAAIAGDSHLRLWECFDTSLLVEWNLIEDIDLNILPNYPSSSNNYHVNTFPSSVSSTGSGSGPVKGFDPGASSPSKYQNPGNISLSPGTSSNGTADGAGTGSTGGARKGSIESEGAWSLSWIKEVWWGERIAVSSGTSGIIRLFHLPSRAPWTNFLNLIPPRASSLSPNSPISSLAWSPSSGRSFQLIASGTRDGKARIWKVITPDLDDVPTDAEITDSADWTATLDSELLEESRNGGMGNSGLGSVNVAFNNVGTVCSTTRDGKVRLWKSFGHSWRIIAVLAAEHST